MKNSIYTILVLLLTSVAITSCEDELNIDNPNALTTEQFWVSEDDARQGINSVYAMFYKDGSWSRWMYFRLDLTSDEGFSKSPWVELADWTRFQYINYNFWEGNVVTWRDTYKAIFRANQVLAHVPEIEFSDPQEKAQILAEARFLRALNYYYAAVLWEDIPLVLEPSKPNDTPQQVSQAEIFAQIEQDLNEAFVDLPLEWPAQEVGRPTKGAVQALLAKTYMQQHQWEAARQALEYLISGEGAIYSLVDNYQDNFTHYNENNQESVFEIQFGDQRRGDTGEGPDAAVSSTRAQFFAPRGIGWSDGQARYWVVDLFKQETTLDGQIDPRLQYTLFYPDQFEDFGELTYGRQWQWDADEAWFKKGSRDYYRDNEDYYSEVNWRLIRYADILLRYAEVLNELGQTADAYNYVDMVRARANMAPLAQAYPDIGTNQQAFLERLKLERVLELAGESVRWEDLKRWGDLQDQTSVDELAQRDPDFNNFVVGRHHRLPIPQEDVENNPNLEQHPEY